MRDRNGNDGECPRCGFRGAPAAVECAACGVVFARIRGEESGGPGPGDAAADLAPGVWTPGSLVTGDGDVSRTELATLTSLPRPLRWVAGLHTAGGIFSALVAAGCAYGSLSTPAFRAPALLNGVMAAIYLWIAWAVRRRLPVARVALVVAAFVGLLAFPLGTVLSILLLVYLRDAGMPVVFSGKDPLALTTSEVELLRGVHASRAGVWFVRIAGFFLVVAALGVVAAIGLGGVASWQGSMRTVRAESDLMKIDSAVRDHALAHDAYPPTQRIESLMRTLERPIPTRDPWGRAYRYELAGSGTFRVASAGPDGEWTRPRLSSYESGEVLGDDIVASQGSVLRGPDEGGKEGDSNP